MPIFSDSYQSHCIIEFENQGPYLFLEQGDRGRLFCPRLKDNCCPRYRVGLPEERHKGQEDVRSHVLLAFLEAGHQGGADGTVQVHQKVTATADHCLQALH